MDKRLEGRGLFSGAPVAVSLRASPGPSTFAGLPLGAWRPASRLLGGARTTILEPAESDRRVALVEHLFAAMGALGLYAGVRVDLEPADAGELPLLDGGSRAWCEALGSLGVSASAPDLAIVRAGEVVVGESRYSFAPGGGARCVDVELAWPDEALAAAWDTTASWDGDAEDFFRRVAPARTFATARDLEAMSAAGTAAHADDRSAFVIDAAGRAHASGPAPARDEPARHKLLDLVGDLFVHGGPPVGCVRAYRPGHAATHAAVAEALAHGLVQRLHPSSSAAASTGKHTTNRTRP